VLALRQDIGATAKSSPVRPRPAVVQMLDGENGLGRRCDRPIGLSSAAPTAVKLGSTDDRVWLEGKVMSEALKCIAEQQIVIWRTATDQKKVTIRISEPRLEKDGAGNDAWACHPRLDGLIDLHRPVFESSSFRALVVALQVCRQLIRDESKGARIFFLSDFHGDRLLPDDGLSLKELFETA
jgi:hypothetical protein